MWDAVVHAPHKTNPVPKNCDRNDICHIATLCHNIWQKNKKVGKKFGSFREKQ